MAKRSGLGYIPALDGVRGIAIALVVGLHAYHFPVGGFLGVDLFFALSGFLITTLLLDEADTQGRISLRAFYERRIRRLLPALVVLLVVYSGVEAARGRSLFPALAGLLYFSNVLGVFGWKTGALRHLWSLAAEEQFYLVWPPVVLLLARHRQWLLRLLLCVLALAVAHRLQLVLSGAGSARIDYAPDTRSDAIVLGCVFALWRRRSDAAPAAWRRMLLVLGPPTVILVLTLHEGSRAFEVSLALVAACFAALVAEATRDGLLARALSISPLVGLGRISYALYLWHVPILFASARLSPELGAFRVTAAVAASLAVAAFSTHFVERRFREGTVSFSAWARTPSTATPYAGRP